MTKRQTWQYRCDFCGKRGLSASHMTVHERHCTANPNRICRFHLRFAGGHPEKSAGEMASLFSSLKPNYGMSDVRAAAEECPVCILAAIRQSGIQKWDGDPESPDVDLKFDFKAEMKTAWDAINDAEYQTIGGGF